MPAVWTRERSLHRSRRASPRILEQAHTGTLLLDEVGDLPLSLQPKLLDVLERKSIRRLGGEKEINVDFRLISATHRDQRTDIKKNLFRQDLFYRLAVVELEIAPLRQRPEDITLLAGLFFATTRRATPTSPRRSSQTPTLCMA
ncbi:MAG: hypothetical protein EP343_09930 [Deltaproteobacteria bacterium]|nr:MAG: hypothetical protein EP343_09930 [Deltaproteobacteria bacterium]